MSSLPPVARGPGPRRLHCRRSRNGCLTCKRRKVRCNEEKPQCYHCHRLNLECLWKDTTSPRPPPLKNTEARNPPESNGAVFEVDGPSPSTAADFFDFSQSTADPTEDFSMFQDIYLPDFDFTAPGNTLPDRVLPTTDQGSSSSCLAPPNSPPQSPVSKASVGDSLPFRVPPILDPLENGPKCASVRALFDSMATSSPMVRYSIAAFAAIQFYSTGQKADYQQYYDKAANDLSEKFHKSRGTMTVNSNELGYVLTTIFFLTYINVCSPMPYRVVRFS